MMRSLWTAASGMRAQQVNVDTIANNVANINTIGYKSQQASFKSLLYQNLQSTSTNNAGENKPVAAEVGLGSRVAAITSTFTQGNLTHVENPFSVALEGDGFFQIRTESGELQYTRDGSFEISPVANGNMLCTSDGNPVLDAYGNELPYDQMKTFTFVLYKGDSTDEADYITEFAVCQGGSVALKTITDQNGNKALEDGQVYTVKEKLVNGYELVGIGQKGTELSKENKYTFTYYDNLDSISIQVKNQEYGYELPATGGTGTTVYTIGGAAIMLMSSLLYGYRMRRKRERGAGI